jgi:hypothetical protein
MSGSRDELLKTLAQLSRSYPEWRFGQLVANVAGWADRDVWEVDDQLLLDAAQLHLKNRADQQEVRS